MLRFIFFKGLYSTLDLYTDEMLRICRERGYEAFVLHTTYGEDTACEHIDEKQEKAEREKLLCFLKKPVTAAIGFGNMGLRYEMDGIGNVWDAYGVPYIDVMMDHPFHFSGIFRYAAKNTTLLCPDRNHVKYIRRFFPEIARTEFLPHAGMEPAGEKKPIRERSIEVLYAGGLSRGVVGHMVPDLNGFSDFDADRLTQNVLDDLLHHPYKTTEAAIEEYLKGIGIFYPDKVLREVIRKLRFLDSYITSFFREMTVKLLVESGVKVTLYGAGWDVCDWIDHPNLDYRGVIPAQEIPELMTDAKIVLNTMTWFKDGSHDRVFNGMLAGAVVVSDTSGYMKETFTDGRELVFFELERLGELPERVRELLADEHRLQQIADCGYAAASEHHRMENRFDEILRRILNGVYSSRDEI